MSTPAVSRLADVLAELHQSLWSIPAYAGGEWVRRQASLIVAARALVREIEGEDVMAARPQDESVDDA